jgi:hypothetical protein
MLCLAVAAARAYLKTGKPNRLTNPGNSSSPSRLLTTGGFASYPAPPYGQPGPGAVVAIRGAGIATIQVAHPDTDIPVHAESARCLLDLPGARLPAAARDHPRRHGAFAATGIQPLRLAHGPAASARASKSRLYEVDPAIRDAVEWPDRGAGLPRGAARGRTVPHRLRRRRGLQRRPGGAQQPSNITPYQSARINRQINQAEVDNAIALAGVRETGQHRPGIPRRGNPGASCGKCWSAPWWRTPTGWIQIGSKRVMRSGLSIAAGCDAPETSLGVHLGVGATGHGFAGQRRQHIATAMSAIRARVASVALPICGVSTTLGSSSAGDPPATGSVSKTSSPRRRGGHGTAHRRAPARRRCRRGPC